MNGGWEESRIGGYQAWTRVGKQDESGSGTHYDSQVGYDGTFSMNGVFSIDEAYAELHGALLESLQHLAKELLDSKHMKDVQGFVRSRGLDPTDQKTLTKACLLYTLYMFHMEQYLKCKCMTKLKCYSPTTGDVFTVEGEIMRGTHVTVLHGRSSAVVKGAMTPVVIKWSGCRDVLPEIKVYNDLKAAGCEVPWVAEYKLVGEKAMVMQRLRPLNSKDNAYEVGRQILKQLAVLHEKVGVHNDIKPDNIMALDAVDEKKGEKKATKYFLIDHGGVTITKLGPGYRRRIWTRHYTAQRPHVHDQLTSAKYDFIELAYTIQSLLHWHKERETIHLETSEIQSGFEGPLADYMELATRLSETHEKCRRGWMHLDEILAKGIGKSVTFKSGGFGIGVGERGEKKKAT